MNRFLCPFAGRILCGALVFVLCIVAGSPSARAAVIETEHVRAELTLRAQTVAPGDAAQILIAHELTDGWHTYWLNPGDSGEPPILDWTLPEGGEAEPVRFPAPKLMPYPPLMNYGYEDAFALLTAVTVPADWPAGKPFPVTLRVDWLVCAAICIPEGGETSISVPTGAQTVADSTVAFDFVQAEWALPTRSDAPARYERDGDVIRLASPVGAAPDAHFFALDRDAVRHAGEQVASLTDESVEIALPSGRGRLDGVLEGVITSADGAVRITATGPVDPPREAEPTIAAAPLPTIPVLNALGPARDAGGAAPALGQMVLFAFLGGLLLNLMPCVFPVLALKALGLVQHADAPLGRRSMIAGGYFSGVFTSFAVLCAVLLALKGAGVAVGWGFQLQSPAFVAAMVALLFVIGLNLSGVFEIGSTLTRLGGAGPRDGVAGSFATGALATIVATPCTAPFMAVAVGAALATASAATSIAVFAALAVGLAAPFVALCLVPGLSRVLPRPGVWMVRLKQALAFPIYATAAWLLWVLVQLAGPDAVLSMGIALVLVALAAWLFGLAQHGRGRGAKASAGVAAVSLAVALYAVSPVVSGGTSGPVARAEAAPLAEPFTPARLAALQAEGRPVFLNATAAWCITCKVNERVVLTGEAFASLLETSGVAYLEADWTRRDPDVTRLLSGFGRAGVPLYVYYSPEGEAQVLPQILTMATLRETFAP